MFKKILALWFVFVLGAFVAPGCALADNDTNNTDPVVVIKTVTFDSDQWRKTQDEYVICPGLYRSYFNELRCRISVGGLSGFAGQMEDAKEISLIDAIREREKTDDDIEIKNVKINLTENMVIEYELRKSVKAEAKNVTAEQEDVLSDPAQQLGLGLIGLLDSSVVKIMAGLLVLIGVLKFFRTRASDTFIMNVVACGFLLTGPDVAILVLSDGENIDSYFGNILSTWTWLIALSAGLFFLVRSYASLTEEDLETGIRARENGYESSAELSSINQTIIPGIQTLGEDLPTSRQVNQRANIEPEYSAIPETTATEVKPGKRKIILD